MKPSRTLAAAPAARPVTGSSSARCAAGFARRRWMRAAAAGVWRGAAGGEARLELAVARLQRATVRLADRAELPHRFLALVALERELHVQERALGSPAPATACPR